MAVFDSKGPGRKQCPGCNRYIGVRSRTCEVCAFDFKSADAEKKAQQKIEEKIRADEAKVAAAQRAAEQAAQRQDSVPLRKRLRGLDPRRPLIATPSGPPPFPLPGDITDAEALQAWAEAVMSSTSTVYYTLDALAYWCRYRKPPYTPEWKTAREILAAMSTIVDVSDWTSTPIPEGEAPSKKKTTKPATTEHNAGSDDASELEPEEAPEPESEPEEDETDWGDIEDEEYE